MLKDFVGVHLSDKYSQAGVPHTFMTMDHIFEALDKLDIKDVLLEGQEASIDSHFLEITQRLHERYSSNNILLTNLYQMPDLTHIDKVAFGIKAITPELHKNYTGVDNAGILKNLVDIVHSGKQVTVEAVFIPEYISFDEIEKIAQFISEIDNNILFVLLPYFKAGFNPWRRPTPEEMQKAGEIANKYLKRVFHFKGDEQNLREVFSVFPDERLIV
jgi:pyruvate-formate lyase-activating enzyme